MLARRDSRRFAVAALMLLVAGCTDPTSTSSEAARAPLAGKAPPASTPTVTATLPSETTRDTTLDVQITGSAFDSGSRASFERDGMVDPRVRVNSTRFVKSTSIVANVTIAADAVPDFYNVAVVTVGGKKGMGTELFEVVMRGQPLVGGSHVTAVNALGHAVGTGLGAVACSVENLPFLWRPDGSRVSLPLGTFCGGIPKAINQSGVILGNMYGSAASAGNVLWIPSGSGYSLQELPLAPNGDHPVIGGGLNDAGEIIGWAQGSARLYWWSASTGWLPIQVPVGATACQVYGAINNLGQIAGKCSIGGQAYDGYYWQDHNAAPVLLPRPASGDVNPRDMNDAGIIVGYLYGSSTRAVKWTLNGSSYTVSFLPDLGVKSAAYSVAQDGTVAGSVNRSTNSPRPALWSPAGELTFLGLLNPGNWGEAADVALTSSGLVAGGTQSNQTAMRWREAP